MVDNVHDESHAHAVLKGAMRQIARPDVAALLRARQMKSRLKRYEKFCRELRSSFGDCLVTQIEVSKTKKRQENIWLYFDPLFITCSFLRSEHEKLLNVWCFLLDSKRFRAGHFTIAAVSEHCFHRIIMRSRARTMKEFCAVLHPHLMLLFNMLPVMGSLSEDFVILMGDSYVPVKLIKPDEGDAQIPLLLSWVPREAWTNAQEAKLHQLSLRLDDTHGIAVPAKVFNDPHFLDPEQIIG